jgi:hypothetical protein
MPGTDATFKPLLGGKMVWESSPATYDQSHIILNAGVKNITSGSDGAGTDKIWNYPFPISGSNTPQTMTIEGGDNAGAERMEFGFITDITYEGKAGEELKVAATWEGRQVQPNPFTSASAVALPAVDYIMFSTGKLYLDPIGGASGSTQASNTFLGMKFSIKTGYKSIPTADGALYFSFIKQVREELELLVDITFEHDGTSIAEKANYRNMTPRLMRLQWNGPNVATPGTTYSTKLLRFDLVGKWEKFTKIDDDGGNDIVHGIFRCRYNSTVATFANALCVNETSTI